MYVQGLSSEATDLNGEQTSCANVVAAGGWYVQLLPFADEQAVEQLQKNLEAMAHRSPTQMVRDGLSPEDMLELLLVREPPWPRPVSQSLKLARGAIQAAAAAAAAQPPRPPHALAPYSRPAAAHRTRPHLRSPRASNPS